MKKTILALIAIGGLAVLHHAYAEDVTFQFYLPLQDVNGNAVAPIYSTWIECSYDGGQSFFHVADPAPASGLITVTVPFRDTPWTYLCRARVFTQDRTPSGWSDLLTVKIPQAQAVNPATLTGLEAR